MCEDNEIKLGDINLNSIKKGDFFVNEQKTLREYECDIIKHYLEKTGNDVIATAKTLDIGKSTIYKMIQNGELN